MHGMAQTRSFLVYLTAIELIRQNRDRFYTVQWMRVPTVRLTCLADFLS